MFESTSENVLSPVRMIDVTRKAETEREAIAKGRINVSAATLELIREGKMMKGDVLAVSETAGILAAKETPRLIPLCHPLLLTSILIEFYLPSGGNFIEITASTKGTGKTGFEMEALIAVAVTALNIYDMCKAIDKGMSIGQIRLIRKSGGKSGTYVTEVEKEQHGRCGKLVAVCISAEADSKIPVEKAVLRKGYGLVGDMHAGSSRQVSLLAKETIDKMLAAVSSINPERMKTQKIEIQPGDSAENLLIKGIDLISLPLGTRIHIGNNAIVEVSQIGKEFHKPGYYLLPLEGIFADVIKGGVVKSGDDVAIE